jgi:glyoxylase-like metal-dependent hydrolase (beta-lactamase superfamily II)
VVVIDPGPDVEHHVRALASRLAGAEEVSILLTHGHLDHAGATEALARQIGAAVFGPSGVEGVTEVLAEDSKVLSDVGTLRAIHTPGHTREHLCFLWEDTGALFAGDLVLGEGDTTWVAEYPGCVADYLDSLEKVRALETSVIYPAHGPALTDPGAAIDRFEHHRRSRIRQVEGALAVAPDGDLDELLDLVYGDALPSGLRGAAGRSLSALVDYVRGVRG